jgi:flagellar biosynthetic protein FlhB
MAGQDDEADKSHEPTQHKLDEARKKGEIARSADVTTAAAYGGILLAAVAAGSGSIDVMGSALMVLLDQSSALSRQVFLGPAMPSLHQLGLAFAAGLSAWFLIPAACALLAVFAQRSFVVAPEKLRLKWSRVNPIQNAKNKYGASGLFEFAKSFLKLTLYSLLLGLFLMYRLSDMAGALHAEPQIVGALMARMLVEFMAIVLLIAMPIGALDYMWHYFEHLRRNRMSHREVREEHKQHEGDPHMKQERRQRATKIAMDQMIAKVPEADVVVVNPTHYAVALKWSRLPGAAPECVAKGVDHIAHAIREAACEAQVPIRHDPPTARALYATTEIGQEIDPEHYRAVAAAIRFAETMRRKAGAAG